MIPPSNPEPESQPGPHPSTSWAASRPTSPTSRTIDSGSGQGLCEVVAAVCDAAPLDALPERERAIVAWVDQVTLNARGITDELVARSLDHLRDYQLIELTVLAGTITMLNQYCTAFDVPPPELG